MFDKKLNRLLILLAVGLSVAVGGPFLLLGVIQDPTTLILTIGSVTALVQLACLISAMSLKASTRAIRDDA